MLPPGQRVMALWALAGVFIHVPLASCDIASTAATELRPVCQLISQGVWAEQQVASNASLQPAELGYGGIDLTLGGKPWATLQRVGPAGELWPVLAQQATQCACCKLCQAQNLVTGAPPTSASPVRCKRWSLRLSDGACRLFAPAGAAVRPTAVQRDAPGQDNWYSGTSERWVEANVPDSLPPQGLLAAVDEPPRCYLLTSGSCGASGSPPCPPPPVQRLPPARPPPPRPPVPRPPPSRPPPPTPKLPTNSGSQPPSQRPSPLPPPPPQQPPDDGWVGPQDFMVSPLPSAPRPSPPLRRPSPPPPQPRPSPPPPRLRPTPAAQRA
ncbi:hypothetical protein ABPG75_008420 [Micractinium tetrahymenae]